MQNTFSRAIRHVHIQNNKVYKKNTPDSTETLSISSQKSRGEDLEATRGPTVTDTHLLFMIVCDISSSQRNWLWDMLKINPLNKHSHGKSHHPYTFFEPTAFQIVGLTCSLGKEPKQIFSNNKAVLHIIHIHNENIMSDRKVVLYFFIFHENVALWNCNYNCK